MLVTVGNLVFKIFEIYNTKYHTKNWKYWNIKGFKRISAGSIPITRSFYLPLRILGLLLKSSVFKGFYYGAEWIALKILIYFFLICEGVVWKCSKLQSVDSGKEMDNSEIQFLLQLFSGFYAVFPEWWRW